MSAHSKPSESDSELSDSEGEDDDEMQRAISPFLHKMETMLHEANAVDLIVLSEASPEIAVAVLLVFVLVLSICFKERGSWGSETLICQQTLRYAKQKQI
ncbi:MAG: hypothetical protein SGPRY_007255 [Prymnesium sp.]